MKCGECSSAEAMADDYLCIACRARKDGEGQLYEAVLQHSDDRVAPPENIMTMARVGDRVYLDICEYDERTRENKRVIKAGFSVTARDLKKALDALGF